MVREAAKEAAEEAVKAHSKDVDLKFAQHEMNMRQVVTESVDSSLEKYLGMTNAEHIRSHQVAEKVANDFDGIKVQFRNWIIGMLLTGASVTGLNMYTAKVRIDDPQPAVIYIREDENAANVELQID